MIASAARARALALACGAEPPSLRMIYRGGESARRRRGTGLFKVPVRQARD